MCKSGCGVSVNIERRLWIIIAYLIAKRRVVHAAPTSAFEHDNVLVSRGQTRRCAWRDEDEEKESSVHTL